MNRKWYDVPKDFLWAVAVCKLKKHTVIANGFVMRNIEMEKEECKNPYGWIGPFISLVVLTCCCCGCYSCYRCKVLSRDRVAHDIVLRKQQAFLISQQSHPNVPVVQLYPQQLHQYSAPRSYQPSPEYKDPNQGINSNLGSTNQGFPQVNPASRNQGQQGVPQYGNTPQHATLQPDSIQLNDYGNKGVTNGGLGPPAYDRRL